MHGRSSAGAGAGTIGGPGSSGRGPARLDTNDDEDGEQDFEEVDGDRPWLLGWPGRYGSPRHPSDLKPAFLELGNL